MSRVRSRSSGLCMVALACAAALLPAGAEAERKQAGNLVVSLAGTLSPRELPRTRTAPVSLALSSDFSTADGAPLPRLRRIAILIGNRGRLIDRGLPVCPQRRIRAATPSAVRAACGAARVGRGHIAGHFALPGGPVEFKAGILAFNARRGESRAILAHVHSSSPPMSFSMWFVERRTAGSSSTELVANLPRAVTRWARLTHFDLTLHRLYAHRGRSYSYLNAACSIPRQFTSLVFPLATVTYEFEARDVSLTTVRACRVDGES